MAYVLLTASILFLYTSMYIYIIRRCCVYYIIVSYTCVVPLLCHSAVHALCIQKIALALLVAAFRAVHPRPTDSFCGPGFFSFFLSFDSLFFSSVLPGLFFLVHSFLPGQVAKPVLNSSSLFFYSLFLSRRPLTMTIVTSHWPPHPPYPPTN